MVERAPRRLPGDLRGKGARFVTPRVPTERGALANVVVSGWTRSREARRGMTIEGVADRMAAIRTRGRATLDGLGAARAPDVVKRPGTEIHARRSGANCARAARESAGTLPECCRFR